MKKDSKMRYDLYNEAVGAAHVVLIGWVEGTTTLLSEVVEELRRREFQWNSSTVWTLSLVFYFGLVAAPE
jgi:hypothetical protein